MTTRKYVVTDEHKATLSDKLWELQRRFREGTLYPKGTLKDLQLLIEGKRVEEIDMPNFMVDWQQFYEDVFSLKLDFSDLQIPEKHKGFDRLLIIAKGMRPQHIYDQCKKLFNCTNFLHFCLMKDLNKEIHSIRTAEKKSYAIWVKDIVEANEEPKGFNAQELKEKGSNTITLEERLIYELKYFYETNKHLDVKSATLCTGSHARYTPTVRFSRAKDRISIGDVSASHPIYVRGRAREVITGLAN